MTIYIAGPMTNIPQFNYPAFSNAANMLRAIGYDVISPHEHDTLEVQAEAWTSPDGRLKDGKTGGMTWGEILAKDVQLVADKVDSVAFLPGWEKSRGAKLEATVALLCGHKFYEYREGSLWELNPQHVKQKLAENL